MERHRLQECQILLLHQTAHPEHRRRQNRQDHLGPASAWLLVKAEAAFRSQERYQTLSFNSLGYRARRLEMFS
jgi:hypothetical protein